MVLITKRNMAGEYEKEREETIISHCKELGLPYMFFETDHKKLTLPPQ